MRDVGIDFPYGIVNKKLVILRNEVTKNPKDPSAPPQDDTHKITKTILCGVRVDAPIIKGFSGGRIDMNMPKAYFTRPKDGFHRFAISPAKRISLLLPRRKTR